MKPMTATTGSSHSGARIVTRAPSSTAHSHMHVVMARPAGSRRWTHGATNEPARPPTPNTPTITPVTATDAPSCRASTIRPSVNTWSSMLTALENSAL